MPTRPFRVAAPRVAIACALATMLSLTPAVVLAQQSSSGSALLLFSHAPTLEWGGDLYSGTFLGVGGDLEFGGRWVGRIQADILQASSLSGPDAERVISGFAFIGSLGYRFQMASLPRLSLDLLGHGGYAQVTYNNGNADFTDASPQIGVGLAPHIEITPRLGLTFSVRMLKGSSVGEGTAINRTDVGVGGRLRLF